MHTAQDTTRTISDATLRKWYDRLQTVARARYTKGWDSIVECVGFEDFKADVATYGITNRKAMWVHYRETVSVHADYAADIRAEAF